MASSHQVMRFFGRFSWRRIWLFRRLREPDVSFSAHPAPITQTCCKNPQLPVKEQVLVGFGQGIDICPCSAPSPGKTFVFPLHPSGKALVEVLPELVKGRWIEPTEVVVPATKYGMEHSCYVLKSRRTCELNFSASNAPVHLFERSSTDRRKKIRIDLSIPVHGSSRTKRETEKVKTDPKIILLTGRILTVHNV